MIAAAGESVNDPPRPSFGCIVLTQGRRPDDLARAVGSLLAQTGVEVDVVVVGNGWRPTGLPAGARGVERERDDGIPAGRNFGVPHARGDALFFLDDDASLAAPDALARVAAMLADDPALGMVQLRVDPLGGGARAREWVPRLRTGDPGRGGDVAHVWEGAVAIRRAAFDAAGGWPASFRFVHEGIELAWRVMDAGYRVAYAGDVVALHPPYAPARHDHWLYYGARNRVWLARRNLPWALALPYVASFALRQLPRLDTGERRRAALRGYRDGLRQPAGERRPLRARTLWRMTRLGRPPIF
jgi:GT2 family glycosyltransferase